MRTERTARPFLLLLFALTMVLWLVGLEGRGIWQDEGLTLYQVRLPLGQILDNRIPVAHFLPRNTVPPLYFLLLALWGRLLGTGIWALRLFGLLAALAALALHYRAGAWMGDGRTGRLAALLAALSPLYLWYVQELRMYGFLLLPATLSMALLWRGWQATQRGAALWPWVLGYALSAAALAWTHYLALLLVAAQGLWLAALLGRRRPRVLVGGGLLLGLAALPLLPVALPHLRGGAWRDYLYFAPWVLAGDALQSFGFGLPGFQSLPEQALWQLPLLLALLGLGLWEARRRGGWPLAGLLAGCLLLPPTALYLASFVKPFYQNARHLLFVAPSFTLLLALGLQRLATWRRWGPLLVLPLLAYGWLFAFDRHFNPPTPPKNDVRPLFESIAAQAVPGDVVALNDPVLQHALDYFAPGLPWLPWPPFGEPLDDARATAAYEATAAQYARVWYVYGPPDTGAETWQHPRDWLQAHHGQLSYLQFPGQTLVGALRYDLQGPTIQPTPQPVAVPLTASFPETIRFLGLFRPLQGARAGQRLVVETLWTVAAQPTTDFQLRLSLEDGAGRSWHQAPFVPFDGIHPTSRWLPGQWVRLPLFLTLPDGLPPGAYTLRLALLAPDGRTITPDEGGPLPLGTLTVGRAAAPAPLAGSDVGALRLAAAPLPPEIAPAGTLPLTLHVAVTGGAPLPDGWQLRALDGAGATLWEQPLPLAAGLPTGSPGTVQFGPAQWQPGDRFDLRYEVALPPTLEGRVRVTLQPLQGQKPMPVTTLWGLRRRAALELGALWIPPRPRRLEPPPVATPQQGHWPGTLRLVGYSLEPAAPTVGQPLTVRVIWQAEQATARPYKVFLHALEGGSLVAGADAFFDVPSTLWQAGEFVISEHRFEAGTLPATGVELAIGLYHEASGERLASEGGADSVLLGTLEGGP